MSADIEQLTKDFQSAAVVNLKAQRAHTAAWQEAQRLDEVRHSTDEAERKAARALINALGAEAIHGNL